MINLTLYSTIGCHLCEQAQALLAQQHRLSITLVDVADSPALMERYGVRIPVLYHAQSNRELGWPFDEITLTNWVDGL